jgi:hypothetical protein
MKRKVIRTTADVLVHSYGKESIEASPPPAPPIAPPPPPPPPQAPAPEPEAQPEPELSDEDEAIVAKFVDGYTKAALVEIAETDGVDTSGNKTDIATRLVLAGFVPEE